MASSDKSNSGAETKKKTSALDANFGNDFLNFWGPPKKGKDNIHFGVGEAPKNKKEPFDFDKLDDFELSGDFGKLPDFKMNMTDLDFSSVDVSNKKQTAKPAEKQESKKDDFSFDFDFNGLDQFDFGSGPAESKSKSSTFKHAMNHDSKSNSSTSTDLLKDKEKSESLDKISATSKHENTLESKSATSEGLEGNVMPHELLSEMKGTSISDRNKDKTYSNEDGHKKQAQETCFARITTQDFILQSQFGGCSAEDDNQQFAVKVGAAMEKSCSMRTDSSHSKHNVPENSGNSECFPETGMNKQSTSTGDLQNKFEGNQNVVACEMEVPCESYQSQLRLRTNTEEKCGLESNLNLPVRKSYSSAFKPMSLNVRLASVLQKSSLKKSAENALHHASLATNREAKKNQEHAESINIGIAEPYEAGLIKEVSNNSRREKENGQTFCSVPNTTQNIGKLVTLKERNLEFPIKAASKTASSSLMEKSGSMSAFRKKKSFEVSPPTPEKLKSLKHDMESFNKGKSFDTLQKNEKASPIAVFEMSNTDHYNNSTKEVSDVEVHQKDGEIDKKNNKTAPIQQNTIEDVNREDMDNGNTHIEQIEESCFVKPCAENINQDTSTVFPNETESSILPKPASVKEQDDNMRTVGSSLSRSTSPDNSYHSRPNDRKNEILSKLNLSGSNQNSLKIHIDSSEAVSNSKQDLHGEFNHSPPHRSSNSKVTMREKVMTTIHSTSSDKAAQNAHLKSLPAHNKEASSDIKKLKALNISPPLRDSRFSKPNHENIRARNINILKSNDIFSNKSLSVQKSDASRFKPKSSNLLDHPNGSNTMANISLSLEKASSQILKSGTATQAKTAIVAESNSKSPLNKARDNSVAEKSATYAVPMKRKTTEDSTNLNPSKRVMDLPAGREHINISPNSQRAMVPVAENIGASHAGECVNDLNYTRALELGGITTGIERIVPLEKDEIAEKADAYSKELEAMCGRLKIQLDEAGELLARAIVNKNTLSKLKSPYLILDEKFRSLQKNFAATVQAKKF